MRVIRLTETRTGAGSLRVLGDFGLSVLAAEDFLGLVMFLLVADIMFEFLTGDWIAWGCLQG
jgi:hypothetical protein